jgi:DNA-directed RNA polymerase specialized sigma24 family protein
LSFGDENPAAKCTEEAFLAYIKSGAPRERQQLPDGLVRSAVDAVKQQFCIPVAQRPASGALENLILCLPLDERIVFILRNVLGMPEESAAIVTGLSREQIRRLRMQSLIRAANLLRESRPPGERPTKNLAVHV